MRPAGVTTAWMLLLLGVGFVVVVATVYVVLENTVAEDTQETLPDDGTIPDDGDPDPRLGRYARVTRDRNAGTVAAVVIEQCSRPASGIARAPESRLQRVRAGQLRSPVGRGLVPFASVVAEGWRVHATLPKGVLRGVANAASRCA